MIALLVRLRGWAAQHWWQALLVSALVVGGLTELVWACTRYAAG